MLRAKELKCTRIQYGKIWTSENVIVLLQAPFYSSLKQVIQLGCRTAILVAEKI